MCSVKDSTSWSVLLLKIHYFLWFASLSGVLPYYVVFVRTYTQVSATWIGILFSLLPFTAFLFNPLFCTLADKTSHHSEFLITFITLTGLGYGSLLILPLIQSSVSSWLTSCFLLCVAYPSMATVTSLTDSMVMRVTSSQSSSSSSSSVSIDKKSDNQQGASFGQIRVWGTIGYGIFGLLIGSMNDFNLNQNYLETGLIMFIIILIIDLSFIVWGNRKLSSSSSYGQKGRQTEDSLNMAFISRNNPTQTDEKRQVKVKLASIFLNHPKIIQYTIVIIGEGVLMACHWSYFYWFLETVAGPDTLLMGLCMLVGCFLGELTFFYFGSQIVTYVGPSNAFNISLIAFALQYSAYSFLIFPGRQYFVLLIEIAQGPTFGLAYCAMTYIGQEFALREAIHESETETSEDKVHAALQGFLAGCLEGLGLGLGSLAAGLIIDFYGVRTMWLVAAILAVVLLTFNVVFDLISLIRRKRLLCCA